MDDVKVTLFPNDDEESPFEARVKHITVTTDQIMFETEEGILYAVHRKGVGEITIDLIREHS